MWRFEAPFLSATDADPERPENVHGEASESDSLLRRALDELDAPDAQYDRLTL